MGAISKATLLERTPESEAILQSKESRQSLERMVIPNEAMKSPSESHSAELGEESANVDTEVCRQ